MAVAVKIPVTLRPRPAARARSRRGRDRREVLDALFERFGELRERISDEQGIAAALRQRLRRRRGHPLSSTVSTRRSPDGSELTILPAVAGG
jgi:molybdopterin converting factor small subunit